MFRKGTTLVWSYIPKETTGETVSKAEQQQVHTLEESQAGPVSKAEQQQVHTLEESQAGPVSKAEQQQVHTLEESQTGPIESQLKTKQNSVRKPANKKRTLCTLHCDIIGDEFWLQNQGILGLK